MPVVGRCLAPRASLELVRKLSYPEPKPRTTGRQATMLMPLARRESFHRTTPGTETRSRVNKSLERVWSVAEESWRLDLFLAHQGR
jgi:hypothetical protein